MESLLLPSQLYSLPTSFKNSLGLICVLVKCTVMPTQVREGRNALFFFFFSNKKFILGKKKRIKKKNQLTDQLQCFKRMAM